MCMIITEDCINSASYGEICVQCNSCGRFGGSSKVIQKSKLYMLMSELKEYMEHINNEDIRYRVYRKGVGINEFSNVLKRIIFPVYQSAQNCGFSNWVYEEN